MEIRVQKTEIIPFRRPEEEKEIKAVSKEIKVVPWVNQPNILLRNAKAKAYSEKCHEDKYETLGYFVSGALVFLMPFALCILASIF